MAFWKINLVSIVGRTSSRLDQRLVGGEEIHEILVERQGHS